MLTSTISWTLDVVNRFAALAESFFEWIISDYQMEKGGPASHSLHARSLHRCRTGPLQMTLVTWREFL